MPPAQPRKRKPRPTTTASYTAMLSRMLRAYGRRIGEDDDPSVALGAFRAIEAELTDAMNVGLYLANRTGGHSINDLAAALGVSKQAIHKRVQAGEVTAKAKARAGRSVRPSAARAVPRAVEAAPDHGDAYRDAEALGRCRSRP